MKTPFVNWWRAVARQIVAAPIQGRKGALCLFASLAFSAPAWAQDAPTLLRQMQNAEKTVSYQATQIVTRQGERQVAKIWRDGPKRRIEWLAPSVRQGDILVDDGSNVWLYHRAENTVTQTKSRERLPGARNASGPWKVSRVGGAFVLRNGNQIYTLDGQTKALLQTRRGANTWVIKNVRFGAVDDSQFRFRTPSGATITRFDGTMYNSLDRAHRAASWLKVPGTVPDGYRFESAMVGSNQAWLRYSNGVRRFSLFQEHSGQGDVALRAVSGDGAKDSWFWKHDGNRFLATGLSETQANQLSKGLK